MQIETLIDQERGLRKPEDYKALLRAIGTAPFRFRLAGHAWAKKALHPVTTLTLDDLYHGLTPAVVPQALRWPDAS